MSDISIKSISQIHRMLGYPPPRHPLITLLETDMIPRSLPGSVGPLTTELYAIGLKNGTECRLTYGRRSYDFQEASLIFMAPGQRVVPLVPAESEAPLDPDESEAKPDFPGWTLVFHPDLIRRSPLGKRITGYSFFYYHSSEALHVSRAEREVVTGIVRSIQAEFSSNLDEHSHGLIASHIELLLNYGNRFYGRQFITRAVENSDVLSRFESLLRRTIDTNQPGATKRLSVASCARELGYSSNYLSDLLRKETGKSAQEHIYFHLIERAKDHLLTSELGVGVIADALGFEYPQHFSKFFKSKVGLSPRSYREKHRV